MVLMSLHLAGLRYSSACHGDVGVLSEFRSRLVAGELASLALDALLERLAGLGLVRAGGRQRTDSAHVLLAATAGPGVGKDGSDTGGTSAQRSSCQ